MRSSTLRFVVPLLAMLAVAGCKQEGVEGPLAACRPAGSLCSGHADCCSFGCAGGFCAENPTEGGVCSTTDDCQWPRVCVDHKCTSSVACRPSGTCVYSNDCCSNVCSLGQCAADHPPIAVIRANGQTATPASLPFKIPIAFSSTGSNDPETGTIGLLYAWSVTTRPPGSVTQPETPSGATTFFTPDVIGTYVIQLTVTAGGRSGTATFTVNAINTPPRITMQADVQAPAWQSRNVPISTTATVGDDDGGPVTCRWSKTSPTGVVTEISPWTTCASANGQAATGTSTPPDLNEDQAGIWILTLEANDGVNPIQTGKRSINVQNDPPVAEAGQHDASGNPLKVWGNIGLGPIPLHGTATDINSDVINGNQGKPGFTWEWMVTAVPPDSGSAQLNLVIGTTPDTTFTPDREGIYTLTLTVNDGHGGVEVANRGTDSDTVDVDVQPYILPLGEVVDAEYIEGSNPEQLAIVQVDAGNAYKLTIVDPSSLTVTSETALAARPTALGLSFTPPAQSEAIIAETGGLFEHVVDIQTTLPSVAHAVPNTAGIKLPADLVDVVHGGTYAYGMTASGTVYVLSPNGTMSGSTSPWYAPVGCPNCGTTTPPIGTRAVGGMTGTGTTPTIWLMSGSPGRIARYDVHSNGNLINPVWRDDGTFAGATGLWLSLDVADLYTTRTSVYDASDIVYQYLEQRIGTSLLYVPDHLDTALSAGSLVGALAQYSTASLLPFSRASVGGTFGFSTPKAYPFLGVNGQQVTNYGRFAFVKSGGGDYYAIVRANIGTTAAPVYKWGVVNLK